MALTNLQKIYTLFGLTTTDIAEDVTQYYLDEWASIYPDNDCLALYNATVSVLEYMIKQADITDASVGTLAQEKEGNTTITYDTSTDSSSADYWRDILERFLNDPELTYPTCRSVLSISQKVFIGGTSAKEAARVSNKQDSVNQYSERSPYATRTPDRWHRSHHNINGVN